MKKVIISVLLCAAMIVGLSATAFAAPIDISEGAWYYDAVKYCMDNNIMNGVEGNKFNPDGIVTRGQFITALYRIAKNDGKGFTGDWMFPLPFSDVAEIPTYAYEAAAWFSMNQIVEGGSNGRLGAGDPISREQMATILYRYVKFCGEGFNGSWMFLLPFEDRAEISDWAYEAVSWCFMNKIIDGKNGNMFDPDGTAKRSEAAAVLQRFCGDVEADAPITGGWNMNTEFGEFEIPEGAKAAFDAATAGLLGARYEPVAYLGSQVVAGANYAFLCKVTTVSAEPATTLNVVTVYKDLEGNAIIKNVTPVADCVVDADLDFSPRAGGISAANACGGELDEKAKAAFDTAVADLLGVSYKPIACLGNQVVAGMNYAILCTAAPIVPNAETALAVLTIYADFAGNATINSIDAFVF